MRIICDTNVLISGLIWQGLPSLVMKRIHRGLDELFIAGDLISEMTDVINRSKFSSILERAEKTPHELVAWVLDKGTLVYPMPLNRIVVEADLTDDAVLACAAAARADYIVSGDRHLLDLESFEGIPVADPADHIRQVEGGG